MPNSSDSSSGYDAKVKRITEALARHEWLEDLEVLRRLIGRTETLIRPVKRSFSNRSFPFPDFRIATVSTDVSVRDLVPFEKDGYCLAVVSNRKDRRRLRKQFLSYLKRAGEERAQLVCFNELAYPTPLDWDGDEDRAFEQNVMDLVEKYGLCVIAGTFHDTLGHYNLGPVFFPVPAQQDDQRLHHHAKLTSAARLFEMIRVPSNRDLRYYETEYGSFTILICLDVYDPALALRLIKMNHPFATEEKIEIVFVPSFSPENAQATANACKDLSYASASLVVFVNCSSCEPRHAVFLAGRELKKSKAPDHLYKVRRISANLLIHEVSYEAYRRYRDDLGHSYSAVFDYLIGLKGGIRYGVKV
jgi:predicted amidohydrolase